MSGQAALASARKRRVNIPAQQSGTSNSNNSNSYQRELNNIAEEFSKNIDSSSTQQNQGQRVPLANIVMLHDRKINILKKELDEIKETTNNLSSVTNSDEKVNFSQLEQPLPNDEIKQVSQKLGNIEQEYSVSSKKLDEHESRIKKLEEDFGTMKKDVENFKVIFLNVNKIINDLKGLTDANTTELGNIKSFLDEHNFVTKDEDNSNKVELEVTEK
jgi:uncharacterized protein (DUF3084 family)